MIRMAHGARTRMKIENILRGSGSWFVCCEEGPEKKGNGAADASRATFIWGDMWSFADRKRQGALFASASAVVVILHQFFHSDQVSIL